MRLEKYQVGRLVGLAAAGVALPWQALAAQDVPAPPPVAAPTPAPAPSRSPSVLYLPNTGPGSLDIGPRTTPTPRPLASPAPSPARRVTPTPTPQPTAAPTRVPAPQATSSPLPQATVPDSSSATLPPPVAASPLPAPSASSVAAAPLPVPAAADPSWPGWVWALMGAGGAGIVFAGFLAIQRRRSVSQIAAEESDVAASVAVPPTPASPVTAPPPEPAPRPPVAPPALPSPGRAAGEPFDITLRPVSLAVGEREVVLEFELLIGNLGEGAAENIRPQLSLMSAHPEQDRQLAAFHANPVLDTPAQPFDLPVGAGGRMPVRLTLLRERLHVVDMGGRPMFVPMVMVDLRWRAGISIRRFGADFMVGTAGQAGKVGPIWLDRPPVSATLAATRYRPREVAAA